MGEKENLRNYVRATRRDPFSPRRCVTHFEQNTMFHFGTMMLRLGASGDYLMEPEEEANIE